MRSNLPVTLDVRMSVAVRSEAVTVKAEEELVEADSSSTETDLDETFIKRSPGAVRANQLQRLIATTPGWFAEDNGLLHVRGVDDGIVYVVDGIPIIGRLDALSASAFDTEMARSINVLTGNIPAEFGGQVRRGHNDSAQIGHRYAFRREHQRRRRQLSHGQSRLHAGRAIKEEPRICSSQALPTAPTGSLTRRTRAISIIAAALLKLNCEGRLAPYGERSVPVQRLCQRHGHQSAEQARAGACGAEAATGA